MHSPESITYAALLRRAWPIILANSAVPLLGLVDTAVIGNVGMVEDLGAIAFGALIFSFVYWSFGFLRMGTTGFSAQAFGAGKHRLADRECRAGEQQRCICTCQHCRGSP